MKKLFAVLLILSLCLSMLACRWEPKKEAVTDDYSVEIKEYTAKDTEEHVEPIRNEVTPILYEVTDGDGHSIWLFGSIHVGTEDFYPLPDYVTDAFERCDALAVEFDIVAYENDMAAQMETMTRMLYNDGTTIRDHISEELYNSAVEIMEECGIYNSMLDYYIPSVWESFIIQCITEQLGVDMDLGVDRHLIDLAYESDKRILDVESADFQTQMMADFSEELQIYLLKEMVESYDESDEYDKELQELMDFWASGDEERFNEYLEDEVPEDPEEYKLYEEYNRAMLLDRNDNMTEYAVDALTKNKELFICVGAAHVMGESGMAEQLRGLGYTVERVN